MPTTSPDDDTDASYARVPFALAGDATPRHPADPVGVSWRPAYDDAELMALFARVLADSIDPRDAASVRTRGAEAVAEWMLHDAQFGRHYECDRDWWSIVAVDDVAAGLVLPVVFTGCARDGLDEATIYHIGVDPGHRGRGLGRLLLSRATNALLAHGVWQISADTAAENVAMISIFTGLGYTRGALMEVAASSRRSAVESDGTVAPAARRTAPEEHGIRWRRQS